MNVFFHFITIDAFQARISSWDQCGWTYGVAVKEEWDRKLCGEHSPRIKSNV